MIKSILIALRSIIDTLLTTAILSCLFISASLLIFGTIIWVANKIVVTKDLSQIQGTWLAEDGSEALNGKLALRITSDSAYFGDRVYSNGRTDSTHTIGTILRISEDSLKLIGSSGRVNYAWKLEYLDSETLSLKGDSYTYIFTRKDAL